MSLQSIRRLHYGSIKHLSSQALKLSSSSSSSSTMSTSLDEQIKKQVEFYFSDSNFRRDRFLQEETKKHEGGFVPFKVLFTFKKLAALTVDGAVLQAAVADSDVVELNEPKDALRRKHALPETDDAADRTLVLAGLGSTMPMIDEIKAAFEPLKVDLLYIQRRSYRKRFTGVVSVEFKTTEELKRVLEGIEGVMVLEHKPRAMVLRDFEKLPVADRIEFEKAVSAMLVAKDVPEKPIGFFYDELLPVWSEESRLRARVKYVAETKELYLLFSQVAFAEEVLAKLSNDVPVIIDESKLSFELVTDAAAIAARPRSEKDKDEAPRDNKRKRDNEGKAIHISNIGSRTRMDDIKKLIASVMDADARSPFIEYEGLDRARFVLNDPAAATALFEKLQALPDAELGGQKVDFHFLEPSEKLQVAIKYEQGLIVEFDGVEAEISRDDIKNTVNEKLGEKAADGQGVAFIKYQIGDKSGYLRVTNAELAKEVVGLFTAEGGLDVNGTLISQARLVDGEAEKKFWQDAHDARVNRFKQARTNKTQQGGRGGGRGGGRRFGGRGGRGGGRR